MRRWRGQLVALALGAAAGVAGCLDVLAPPRAPRVGAVAVAPLFETAGGLDAIPADVDSIAVTIHNPPAADTTVGVRIAPGQDSIVISIDVPVSGSGMDTVLMGMQAIRSGPPAVVLYRADSVPLVVRAGVPTRADTVRATYVGPGAGVLGAIALAPRSAALTPGGTVAFTVTALDSAGAACCAGMPILWASRAAGVAPVSVSGVVTGRADGDAWIVATSGASAAIRDSVLVVVAAAPVPLIGLAPISLAFTDTAQTADPPAQTVAVTDAGTGTLANLALGAITYGAGQPTGWLTASLSGATAPATLTVTVAKGALAPGTYSATVAVASPAAPNSPQFVAVSFTLVSAQAAIALSPATDSVTDTLTTTDPAPRTVAIANGGAGVLSGLALGTIAYGAGQSGGWLAATLNGTTAPTTVTLNYSKGSLTAGRYTASVPVTSPAATNTPQTLTVVFVVRPGPAIGVSPSSLTFADTILEADPPAQSVSVSNTSGGTLSGLSLGAVSYGAGQPTGWLTPTLTGTTAPTTITLAVAKGALAAGTYTAMVPVTSPVASSVVNLPVTLNVLPPLPATIPVSATAPAYLKQIALTFTGASLAAPLVFTFPVTAPGVAGGTVQVPAGAPLQLTVQGFDSSGVMTHQADTTLTPAPGANPTLNLVLSALNGTITITWSLGAYTVLIAQPDTTLGVGQTLRYTATILDPQGNAIAGATPTWASTNPAVVSIDASGLARALVSGTTRVVATYLGAAASRAVTVP